METRKNQETIKSRCFLLLLIFCHGQCTGKQVHVMPIKKVQLLLKPVEVFIDDYTAISDNWQLKVD